jgi:hypothetical protein
MPLPGVEKLQQEAFIMAKKDNFDLSTPQKPETQNPYQPPPRPVDGSDVRTPVNPNPEPVPPLVPGNNPYAANLKVQQAPLTADGQPITDEMVLPEDHEEPLANFQMFRTYIKAAAQQAEKEVTGNTASLLGRLSRDLDKMDGEEVHNLYLRWLDDLREAEAKAAEEAGDAGAKSVDEEKQHQLNEGR